MIPNNFIQLLPLVFIFVLAKYIILMGGAYLIFWKWLPHKFLKHKIQKIERAPAALAIELKYSFITIIVQSVFLSLLIWGAGHNWFKIDLSFGPLNMTSEILAFLLYFVIYDAYFYWTHRWLHQPWLYKYVHVIHHRSLNPTPWASYSFHPLEALINIFYMLPFVFFIPISLELFCVLLVLTDMGNLIGHLGYDFLPRGAYDAVISKWLTTPTHHNMHHQYSKSNFGLYWRGWDQLGQTLHPRTKEEFLKVKSQTNTSSSFE